MLSKNQIKEIQLLHQKKQRDLKKLFIAEGMKTVMEVLTTNPDLLQALYATSDFISLNEKKLKQTGLNYFEITQTELEKISLQKTPNQVLAVCSCFKEPDISFDFENNFSFYLDDIRDPGNFGTILRLVDWFGISSIFCSPESCDLYNPKVIQSSMGAFLRVKVVYTELSPLTTTNNIKKVYGAVLNGKNLYKEFLGNGLIVIGNEANGIRKDNLKYINSPLTIPSHKNSQTESLNAAMAASIIASEFFRTQEK